MHFPPLLQRAWSVWTSLLSLATVLFVGTCHRAHRWRSPRCLPGGDCGGRAPIHRRLRRRPGGARVRTTPRVRAMPRDVGADVLRRLETLCPPNWGKTTVRAPPWSSGPASPPGRGAPSPRSRPGQQRISYRRVDDRTRSLLFADAVVRAAIYGSPIRTPRRLEFSYTHLHDTTPDNVRRRPSSTRIRARLQNRCG